VTRACARCGAMLEYPVVTVILNSQHSQETTWFCSKPRALEYLEQDILDDAREAQQND
jgi:hypothetical protein